MNQDYLIKKKPMYALALFALPMIIGNLFQQTYTMVDSAIVGRYVSEQALAAVGASYSLLAGFAMLYMQQSSRDSKVRLVLLDEAFSKMDKERSEVCLRYARELELQLIVCVPDERLQSLIRNVDCVYGFRRYQNQISMMHIDKGSYLEMIAGEKEDGDEAGADETEDTVIE